MKKILLISVVLFTGAQTFSFAPGNAAKANTVYSVPGNMNAMALKEFLKLTPKEYQKLTGKKMTFKQKLAFAILKLKLKKQLPDDKTAAHKTDIGLLSLIFGGSAFVLALIPYVGLVSILLALAAIVLGIIGLGRKKGDTKSIIGLVLGGAFLLLFIVLLATFSFY
ncbi:MAG: hypothetical protein ACR2KX_09245 [Chitinophagaceae bacterium]